MKFLLVIVFVAWMASTAIAVERPYTTVTVRDLAITSHTHICVSGLVTAKHREADGDLHIRLEEAGKFVIVEEIPRLSPTGPRPIVGKRATACGISRFDKKHGWAEIHPVEMWR